MPTASVESWAQQPTLSPSPVKNTLVFKKGDVERLIRDAENLSLIQDRVQACTLLARAQKNTTLTPEDLRRMREKNQKLARVFYTEKGFQASLAAGSLLNENKPKEAIERFSEAQELEHSNLAVSEGLIRAQLRLKNHAAALNGASEALVLYPLDIPILQEKLQAALGLEDWPEAAAALAALNTLEDRSAQTLKERAILAIRQKNQADAEHALQEAINRDKDFPESYYWLASMKEKPEARPSSLEVRALYEKYRASCVALSWDDPEKQVVAHKKYERENNLCGFLDEVRKKLK